MATDAQQIPPVGERWKWFEDTLIRGLARMLLDIEIKDHQLNDMFYKDDGIPTLDIRIGKTAIRCTVTVTVIQDDRTDEEKAAE